MSNCIMGLFRDAIVFLLRSLSSDVFERRTSTGSGLFEQVLGQIVSVKVKTPNNTDLVASEHIKREKGSLPVDVRQSKTSLLKRPKNDLWVVTRLRGRLGHVLQDMV